MRLGGLGMTVFAVLQLCCTLWLDNFIGFELISLLMLLNLGMTFTTSTSLAMDSGRDYTGAAAAIVGAIGFVFGGIVSPIVGLGDIPLTTSIVLIVCSAASWMMARAVSAVK
jgi:DHA1 family bicyclomycin/chloramphenicol resistance-like MFS transporter